MAPVIGTVAQMCPDDPVTTGIVRRHCPRHGYHASVRGVEGSDALLAARLVAGDDHALADVSGRLATSVHGGALRVLGNGSAAQDVVQDVFVELWRHPDRYDPAAGSLRTYLMVLARHRAVDLLLPAGGQPGRRGRSRPAHHRGFRPGRRRAGRRVDAGAGLNAC